MACSAVGNFHAATASGTNFPMLGGAGLPPRFRVTERRAVGEGLCAVRAASAGLVIHCRRSTGCFSLQMFRSNHFSIIGVGVCSCNGDGLRTGLSNRVFGVADGDSRVGGRQRTIRGIGVAGDRIITSITVDRFDDHTCRFKDFALGVFCLGGRRSHLDALQFLAAGQNTVSPDSDRGNAQISRAITWIGVQIFLIDINSVGYRDHRTLIQALCLVMGSKADRIAGEISLGLSIFEAQQNRCQDDFCLNMLSSVILHGLHNDIACLTICREGVIQKTIP